MANDGILGPVDDPSMIDPNAIGQAVEPTVEETIPDPAEVAFINSWISKIDKAKVFHKKKFDKMIANQELASGKQWPGQTEEDDRYVVNVIGQVLRQRVASLYAKNPTVIAKRRPRLDYRIWDGRMESLQQAMTNPMDPANQLLIADVQAGHAQRTKIDGISRTLEIAVRQHLQQQFPDFKRQMKIMVRRTETCGVGYVKLDFQREMQPRPEIETQIVDCTNQLSEIKMLMAQQSRGDFDENSAKAEQLEITIKSLQEKKYCIMREGVVWSFPRSTALIIDPSCTQLEGFLGAGWIAEEFYLPKDEVERIYGIDASKTTNYNGAKSDTIVETKKDKDNSKLGNICFYEIYDCHAGTRFTIMRGCNYYLRKPEAPNVCLERFFPYFALTFNDIEDETEIFPPSTVELLKHVQLERNRTKEALRQHRIAKAPKYGGNAAKVSQEDRDKLSKAPAHHVQWFEGLQPGEKSEDIFWEIKTANIDPNVYEVGSLTDDVTIAVGMSDAHLGAVSGATATESSIAEDSRMSSTASNVDDLDDFLTGLFREVGNIYFMEVSAETIQKAVGPGAVWPELSAEEVLEDIYLEIEAGSSGRPNKAVEVSTLEKLLPLAQLIPGLKPEWLARKMLKLIDENVDLSDAYSEGLPSIAAMNAAMGAAGGANGIAGGMPTGNSMTSPNMQGPAGANKIALPSAPGNMMTPSRGLMTPA